MSILSEYRIEENIPHRGKYTDEDLAEEWAEIAVECIARAGNYFSIRVPLDGEANIGDNWCQTH